MGAVQTQRTLVKSVPEVWAELSADGVLGRMFRGRFGEIHLTHLTPESSIEWEGELAAGLVDNKVCAIDDTWSGLRFVYRLADRP